MYDDTRDTSPITATHVQQKGSSIHHLSINHGVAAPLRCLISFVHLFGGLAHHAPFVKLIHHEHHCDGSRQKQSTVQMHRLELGTANLHVAKHGLRVYDAIIIIISSVVGMITSLTSSVTTFVVIIARFSFSRRSIIRGALALSSLA